MDSSNLRDQLDQTKEGSTTSDDETTQPDAEEPDPAITERSGETDESEPTESDKTDTATDTSDDTASNESDRTDDRESDESPASDDIADDDHDHKNADGPAFPTTESDKTSIYPQTDTARLIRVLCNGVENDLLALGHDDFAVREAHDAMVRLAHEHPREVTQLVLDARGLDPDATDDLP
jgi:hypothetical protein